MLFDFSPAEVAQTLGCSVNCVRQAQHSALKFLGTRLNDGHGQVPPRLLAES
jgi:DNA-directed RNA polymerase specialized sigma24 family protein